MKLTSFTCNRWNGLCAVPSQIFEKTLTLYGKKWNIVKVRELERLPVQGEQEIYNRLLQPDFVNKCDIIANNHLLNGLTQEQIDTNEKETARFAKACGEHWKQVQFWQGNCSAAGMIINKMIELED